MLSRTHLCSPLRKTGPFYKLRSTLDTTHDPWEIRNVAVGAIDLCYRSAARNPFGRARKLLELGALLAEGKRIMGDYFAGEEVSKEHLQVMLEGFPDATLPTPSPEMDLDLYRFGNALPALCDGIAFDALCGVFSSGLEPMLLASSVLGCDTMSLIWYSRIKKNGWKSRIGCETLADRRVLLTEDFVATGKTLLKVARALKDSPEVHCVALDRLDTIGPTPTRTKDHVPLYSFSR